jgi:hypothetical protein
LRFISAIDAAPHRRLDVLAAALPTRVRHPELRFRWQADRGRTSGALSEFGAVRFAPNDPSDCLTVTRRALDASTTVPRLGGADSIDGLTGSLLLRHA